MKAFMEDDAIGRIWCGGSCTFRTLAIREQRLDISLDIVLVY
jgi:hypothetical protein